MTSAPVERTELGNMALTVPAVPTGMNAGVLISPRVVVILPKRALPSIASNENFMPISLKNPELERTQAASLADYINLFFI